MSQPLPYDEIEFDRIVNLDDILNIPNESHIGYFVDVDLSYSDDLQDKLKKLPFCPENRTVSKTDFNEYMKKSIPKTCIPHKKLICDWTDKKKFDSLWDVETFR